MGEDANFFVGFLPGDADFGEGHDDVFAAEGVSAEDSGVHVEETRRT